LPEFRQLERLPQGWWALPARSQQLCDGLSTLCDRCAWNWEAEGVFLLPGTVIALLLSPSLNKSVV